MKEGNDIRAIFHAQSSDFNPNLSNVEFTGAQSLTFEDADVFVKDNHAAGRCSSMLCNNASLASLTTSAIAAGVMRPG